MSAPTNPTAFPSGDFIGIEPGYGMTLRDWFAGQALASVPLRNWDAEEVGGEAVIQKWAVCAYAAADAMLAARGDAS